VRKGQIDPREREKWIEIGENGQRVLFYLSVCYNVKERIQTRVIVDLSSTKNAMRVV